MSRSRWNQPRRNWSRRNRGGSPCWSAILAVVTTTASSRSMLSTSKWRLRPLIRLPPLKPRARWQDSPAVPTVYRRWPGCATGGRLRWSPATGEGSGECAANARDSRAQYRCRASVVSSHRRSATAGSPMAACARGNRPARPIEWPQLRPAGWFCEAAPGNRRRSRQRVLPTRVAQPRRIGWWSFHGMSSLFFVRIAYAMKAP